MERREAQRARSRRFPQGNLLWRAPRPERERVATSVRVARPTTLAPPGAPFPCFGLAWFSVARRRRRSRCLDDDSDADASRERELSAFTLPWRETAVACEIPPLKGRVGAARRGGVARVTFGFDPRPTTFGRRPPPFRGRKARLLHTCDSPPAKVKCKAVRSRPWRDVV